MIIKLAILLAIVLIVAAFAAWAFLPARYLPGNRARHLRIRLHLRLHPGKGFAHLFGLAPALAPPRTYKTAFLADVILRYSGPVIATTTKPDIHALTSAVRAELGPVHAFNPQPSATCRPRSAGPRSTAAGPATAIRRADAFAFAVSQKGVEDGSFWSAKASDYLRGYFHAAALARYDLRAVATWVSGADTDVPERILAAAAPGAPGPDVLDVDQHGPAGNGYPAFARLERAGLVDGASAYVRTRPAGCTPTSPVRTSTTAACPATTWTSAPKAATSWPRPPDRRQILPAHQEARRPQRPGLGRGHRTPGTPAAPATPGAGRGPGPPAQSTRPLGRQPARRQPQRRPVLGRQPRPGRQPRRRSEPSSRRRPPSRPRRTGDHPHPRLRPQDRPSSRGGELR